MFDENDLLHELSRDPRREKAGREFVEGLTKKAFVGEMAAAFGQHVKDHAPEIGAALVGAALAAGGQYLANRKGKKGTSSQQRAARALVDETSKSTEGYDGRMNHAKAKAMSEMSDIMADHPVRGSLNAIPAGAGIGTALVALTRKIRSMT